MPPQTQTPSEPVIIVPKPPVQNIPPVPPISSTPTPPPPPPAPNPYKPHKKFPFFLILILAAIILIGVQLLLSKSSSISLPGLSSTGPKQMTGLQIAEKTATFLDKIMQPDGSFITGYICDNSFNPKCQELKDIPVHTGQGISSYYFLYKATGNQSYKEKADRAMNFVLNSCKTDKQYCELNYFPLMQYYSDTLDKKYLEEGLLPVANAILSKSNEETIMTQAGIKLAYLATVTGDNKYKAKLLSLADGELAKAANNTKRDDYNTQLVWSVYIPAYDVSHDPKYLNASKELIGEILANKGGTFYQPYSKTKASAVLLDLYDITNNLQYLTEARDIMQGAVTELWDTPEHMLYNGDYGFVDVGEQSGKTEIFNGGMINQFIRLGNEKFEI